MVSVPAQYQNMVANAAQATGLPFNVVAAQIALESGWNPNAVSPTGAQGLTQFEPGTWSSYGSGNPFNAQDSINAYVRFMSQLLRQFNGNVQNALAAYNAGPGNIGAGMGYANQILSSAGTGNITAGNGSVAAQTDNSGVSLNNSNVASYMSVPAAPVLSLDQLRSQSPLVAAIVTSVPELQGIFQQAVANSWSTDKFIAAVQNSNWWATHSDTARQAFATMQADPATWNQTVNNLEATFRQLSASLGAQVPASTLQSLAVDAITNGYQDNQALLRQKFAQYVAPVAGDHFGGEAGTDETTLRDAMRSLGVFLPESNLASQLKQIIAGSQTVQGVNAQLRTQAAATYPAYASQINSGMNTSDIAAPFISRAQQLLEQGPGQMNISNPMIKNALQNTQNGVPTPMNMGDFEMKVRRDPAWVSTDNAQDGLMSTAHKVLMDMGLQF